MAKILVISHACFNAINRGVYRLLKKQGENIEIVAPVSLPVFSGEKKADPQEMDDPPIHFIPLIGSNPRIYYFRGLSALLRSKRPEIIVLDNDPISRMAVDLGKWCAKNGASLFCISNENLPLTIASAWRRKGWKGLPAAIAKRRLLSRSRHLLAGVFAINQDGVRIFREEGFRNVFHMPLGFDPQFFFPDADAGKAIRSSMGFEKPVIAYFGRLTREKGIHILLEALKGITDLEWQLMMDSFEPSSSVYSREISDQMIESGLQSRVQFIHPNHFQIASYMNAADIVVVPSVTVAGWKEQYGRVAAEALACGRKVIASDSGALPEVLGGFGWLVREGNVADLKEKLRGLIDRSLVPHVGSGEIARYALENLSIDRQAEVMKSAW